MAGPHGEVCLKCYFCDTSGFEDPEPGDFVGLCRRHPPVVEDASEDGYYQPLVNRLDWCGEFKSRPRIVNQPGGETQIMECRDLSVRARRSLIRGGVLTIDDLVQRTGDELLEFKNLAGTTLNEIKQWLRERGLELTG